MKPFLLTLILLPAALAAPAAAQFTPQATASPGSAPQGINYQGRLEDNGFPATGTKSMVFRVFDVATGGTALWTSPAQAVEVQIGLFNAVVPVPLTALVGGGSRYLEVQIDGTVMAPRELLNSVPYALIAKSVEGTIDVSTAGLSVLANSAATTPALHISSQTGNVGVGTSSPAAAFDVGGSAQFGPGAVKSTFTSTGDLRVPFGVYAGSATLSASGAAQYSVTTASGVSVGGTGGVTASFFSGGALSVQGVAGVVPLRVSQADGSTALARLENTSGLNVLDVRANGALENVYNALESRYLLGPNMATDAGVTGHDYGGLALGGGAGGIRSAITSGGSGINGGVRELYFFTNGSLSTPRLYISASGSVGVSTAAPQATLDVDGSAQFGSGATKSTFTAAGALLVPAASGVGIGTPSPQAPLHVVGVASVTASITVGGITNASVPRGMVSFFNLAACPTGWSELVAGRGRYVVGLPAAGTLAGTSGTALTDLESRPVGQHNHGVTEVAHSHTLASGVTAGAGTSAMQASDNVGNLNAGTTATGLTVDNAGAVAGTNAPYIQLLICQKD